MEPRSDESTRELTSARLRLQDGLVFSPRRSARGGYYCVEFPARGKYYRIGLAEYTFLSLLDGNTTVAEALTLTARCLGPAAFREQEALAICQWLLDTNLAVPAEPHSAARSFCRPAPPATAPVHPFWIKIPLGTPDRWLTRLLPWLSWLHTAPALAAAGVLGLLAAALLGTHWQRFADASAGVLAPGNWISLAACWLALKLLHELSHAVVCKRYGGTVREMGVILVLLTPMAYVDVTSCWRFPSKWPRIHTAAAGMTSELLVAALAVIGWCHVDSPAVQHVLYNLFFMASVTTVVFNANPLMRFDGYYLLSDLCEMPNLYSQGLRWVQQLGARLFLGQRHPPSREVGIRGLFLRGYGLAAFLWRLVVCVSLTVAAAALFEGAGIVLAVLGVLLWLRRPLRALAEVVLRQGGLPPRQFVRLAATASAACGLLLGLLSLPWPFARTAPGIVRHRDLAVVRAGSSGFVQELLVRDGQQVSAGQPLVQLASQPLEAEVQELQLAVELASARQQMHLQKQEVAAAQVEGEKRLALHKRLADKVRQRDALLVRAPRQGRVMAWELESRRGTYVEEGTEILAIGEAQQMELAVSVAEPDAQHVAARIGQEVAFRLQGRGWATGPLRRLAPNASVQPLHAALTAQLGGPLSVVQRRSGEEDPRDFTLTEPRFTATVALLPGSFLRLRGGELGVVSIPTWDQTIGRVAVERFSDWVRRKFDRARSAHNPALARN